MNWDWICGFYEGEGCPSYTQSASKKSGKKRKLRLRIIIKQKERPLLKKAQNFLTRFWKSKPEAKLIHVYPRKKSRKYKKNGMAMLSLDGIAAWSFSKRILPLMHSEKKRAQLRTAMKTYGAPGK